ncbi:DUF1833 family protein [Rhodoferax sp. WC2427]|uniref:DUF1833 family protein n=1 Tax=Rhodoferax sp. WC2427 TaxID=3234144 RepID=UPI00346587B5
MTTSAATTRNLHAVDDPQGVLMLLQLDHPALSGPVRLVNDTRNLVTLGATYLGLPFSISLPNDKAKEVPRAKLQMDNVGRELTAELERLPPGAALMATILMVHRTTPGVVDYSFTAPLSGVRVDMHTLSATMGPDDLLRRPAVLLRYDPISAPALFPD